MNKFHVHHLSPRKYRHTVLWSVALCISIVIAAALLGRATHNFQAALTDKPDVALYLLLEDEGIGQSTLIRENDTERDYLVESAEGPKLVKLKKGDAEWFVSVVEDLHR